MGLYNRYLLPRVVHLACSARPIMKQRGKLVPLARGRVLEIGIGSGLNLPLYNPVNISGVWGLDPSQEMNKTAARAAQRVPFHVELVLAGSAEIPLESRSFDTLLMTYTLCTIADCEPALREMARVLKPGGQLLFCEHGLSPDTSIRRWQNRITPLWRRLGGGCHLNRDIPDLIRKGGFEITRMEMMYIPGWRPASFNFWGAARER